LAGEDRLAMSRGPARWLRRAALILGPLLFYVGSYFALVRVHPPRSMSGPGPWPGVPHYVVGGVVAEVI
jgi:hypothetical protein